MEKVEPHPRQATLLHDYVVKSDSRDSCLEITCFIAAIRSNEGRWKILNLEIKGVGIQLNRGSWSDLVSLPNEPTVYKPWVKYVKLCDAQGHILQEELLTELNKAEASDKEKGVRRAVC